MTITRRQVAGLFGAAAATAALPLAITGASAQAAPSRLRVALLADIANFDPHQFSAVNAPIMKNFYDTLIEYTPEGRAVPSLAASWQIAPDSRSITLNLREGVRFHSGAPFNAEAVDANLRKAADPQRGKNLFAPMSVVENWQVTGPLQIRINFKAPSPERLITDLLQFTSIIDPAIIADAETRVGGTGAYTLGERVVGQRIVMRANPTYWRQGEPASQEVVFTMFSDNGAAAAAFESGQIDMIYGVDSRVAIRLRNAGAQLVTGPGPLVQVFRINTTRGPFRNAKFRQAFNFLMDRDAMLRVGYAGLGTVTALPWAPASPAFDAAINQRFAFNLDRARALIAESGLSAADQSAWKMVVLGSDPGIVAISQILQQSLARVGINIQLDVMEGAAFTQAILSGNFDALFGAVGNVQKFPSRVTTNSIYRTAQNPVLGHPHPFPEYVAAIERVNTTIGTPAEVKAAYDHLNQVLLDTSFSIPTNSYDHNLLIANRNVTGFTLDMDNILILRTVSIRR